MQPYKLIKRIILFIAINSIINANGKYPFLLVAQPQRKRIL
jgi:hypothetical protein